MYGRLVLVVVALLGPLGPVEVHGGPLAYPDFTPRFNDEITELLSSLLDDSIPQREGASWQRQEAWPRAREVVGWAHALPRLGQIAGVAVDGMGRPVVFHRGPNTWLGSSFNSSHRYQLEAQGPIPVDTVLTLHPDLGVVENGWGRNLFYMPHGIAVCQRSGDTWLTDVALHQVFKFRAGEHVAAVTLGERFEPGTDARHFCQPTSVAIASSGDVFVADGYCNHRVLRFTAHGQLVAQLGKGLGELALTLPHGVALLEERDAVCVADREARRITCMRAGLASMAHIGDNIGAFENEQLGTVYGIAISGGLVFAVAGHTENLAAKGITIDPFSGKIVDEWASASGFHSPHTVAVSPDGTTLYVGEIGPNRISKFSLAP